MPAKSMTIRYNNLDGNPVEVEYWFRLDQVDAIEMDFVHKKDVGAYLKEISDNKDSRELVKVWKEMLFRAVAKRDGQRLVKNDDIRDEFEQTGAYNACFLELVQKNDDAGAGFFVSIMPDDIQARASSTDPQPRSYSMEEKLAMTDEEFFNLVGTDDSKYSQEDLLIAFRRRASKQQAA